MRRYKYQLKAFVDRVRVRIPDTWYHAQDSIIAMEWVEAIYEEVSRPFFAAGYCTDRSHFTDWTGITSGVDSRDTGLNIAFIAFNYIILN